MNEQGGSRFKNLADLLLNTKSSTGLDTDVKLNPVFEDTGREGVPIEAVNSVVAAPIRRAISTAQEGRFDEVLSEAAKQIGKDPETAPKWADIVSKAGVENPYLGTALATTADMLEPGIPLKGIPMSGILKPGGADRAIKTLANKPASAVFPKTIAEAIEKETIPNTFSRNDISDVLSRLIREKTNTASSDSALKTIQKIMPEYEHLPIVQAKENNDTWKGVLRRLVTGIENKGNSLSFKSTPALIEINPGLTKDQQLSTIIHEGEHFFDSLRDPFNKSIDWNNSINNTFPEKYTERINSLRRVQPTLETFLTELRSKGIPEKKLNESFGGAVDLLSSQDEGINVYTKPEKELAQVLQGDAKDLVFLLKKLFNESPDNFIKAQTWGHHTKYPKNAELEFMERLFKGLPVSETKFDIPKLHAKGLDDVLSYLEQVGAPMNNPSVLRVLDTVARAKNAKKARLD